MGSWTIIEGSLFVWECHLQREKSENRYLPGIVRCMRMHLTRRTNWRVLQPVSAITTAQPTECRNTNRVSVRIWILTQCSWPHCMDTLRVCSTLKIHTQRCGGYAHMFGVRYYRVMSMLSIKTHFTRTCPARALIDYFHVHHPHTPYFVFMVGDRHLMLPRKTRTHTHGSQANRFCHL